MDNKSIIIKNRKRKPYTFANINLLGKCNADCFFCLGKDIENILSCQNQLNINFLKWKNFNLFLDDCKKNKIENIYLTGQNTDSLMYKYFDELRDYIQQKGFIFGIRTNGYLAKKKIESIKKCNGEIGFSIHSLNEDSNFKILKRKDVPDWDYIFFNVKNCRVSIVINRYNYKEIFDIIKYLSKFDNIKYVQCRRISTDTREFYFKKDIILYEKLYNKIKNKYKQTGVFYLSQEFIIFSKKVYFWRTVETNINSFNYFSDGTYSKKYFVIEGYLENYKNNLLVKELKGNG